MTDTTHNFDPIHRLHEIATTIRESGADIFYAPTTVAYDIECAIKEIERLRRDYSCICNQMRRMMEERDEARRMYLASTCSDDEIIHEMKRHKWDCFKENPNE